MTPEEDTRFSPPPERATCLTCRWHRMENFKDIVCDHPKRPAEMTKKVIRWYAGCPQHKPVHKEDPTQ